MGRRNGRKPGVMNKGKGKVADEAICEPAINNNANDAGGGENKPRRDDRVYHPSTTTPMSSPSREPVIAEKPEKRTVNGADKGEKKTDLSQTIWKDRKQLITEYLERSNQVRLLFLLDATSSMASEINFIKEQFEDMVKTIRETHGQARIRVGVVAYRDFDRGDNHTQVLDFVGRPEVLHEFLSNVQAVGGGDIAEDVFTGLETAATLSWSADDSTNLIFHVADAPCHGSDFHSLGSLGDKYFAGDPKKRDIKTLLKRLFESCGVMRYFFSHLHHQRTVKMIEEFKKAAPEFSWLQDDHVKSVEALKEFICRNTVESVTLSKAMPSYTSHGNGRKPSKNYPIEPREPDWGSLPVLNGWNRLHEMLKPDELLEYLEQGPLPLGKQFNMQIKVAPRPFSDEGMTRYPFHAIWLNAPTGNDANGRVILKERKVVLKEFKYHRCKVKWIEGEIDFTTYPAYRLQAEMQTVASVMAKQFNQDIAGLTDCPSAKQIHFPQVRVVSVQHDSSTKKLYNMEQLLQAPGGFVRFTNNNGAVVETHVEHDYNNSVHAFSHYTYEKTHGRIMVTDLQGCYCKSPGGETGQFTLSDPMIHSNDFFLRSLGNLGSPGAAAFFESHTCNDVCRALGLSSLGDSLQSTPGGKPSPVRSLTAKDGTSTVNREDGTNSRVDFGSYM